MRNKVILGEVHPPSQILVLQVHGIRGWVGLTRRQSLVGPLATHLALSPREDLSASLCKPSGSICPSFSERAGSRHRELPDLFNQRFIQGRH